MPVAMAKAAKEKKPPKTNLVSVQFVMAAPRASSNKAKKVATTGPQRFESSLDNLKSKYPYRRPPFLQAQMSE